MKILSVVGARPNLIKIAPFIRAINEFNESDASSEKIDSVLVHTGQHYDHNMSDSFFEDLNIPHPDYFLDIGSGSHAYQVGQTMIEFEKVLLKEQPDWVVVVGDVNATGACSMTAKKHQFKVAHIEAGLRSNDFTMPEEINRIVTDRISDLLLTPCRFADANLQAEGTPDKKVVRVGNIMIDTLEAQRDKAQTLDINEVVARNRINSAGGTREKGAEPRVQFELNRYEFTVLTMHRPSNVDEHEVLKPLLDVLLEIAQKYPIVFPIHPRTRAKLSEFNLWNLVAGNHNFILTQPLTYRELLCLNMQAKLIMTDSGGLQEEACVLEKPCLTMRWNTERPITLMENGGTSQLVGNDPDKIRNAFERALDFPQKSYRPDLWDGHTAERVVEAIVAKSG